MFKFLSRYTKYAIRYTSKKLLIAILALLVIGVPLLYLSILNAGKVAAAWFDDSWAYRQTVALTNSGSAQTDYQVSITLDTATLITAGKMQSDCDDIRVTDINGKLLPIWIEKGTNACNTSTTAIWTKVPSIPTSGATLYVYYGNPSAASVQNGDNVFIFFDDFEGGNLSKWTNTNFTASTDVANSGSYAAKVTGAISASLFRNLNSSSSLAVLLQQRAVQTNSREDPTLSYTGGVAGNRAFMNLDSDGWSYRDYYDSLGNRVSTGAFAYSANTWYRTEYMVDVSTNKLTMKVNTTTYVNNVDIQDITSIDRITFSGNASLGGTFYFDDVLVAKYSSTPPTVASPASEEKAPGPIAYWKFDEGTGTSANDSTQQTNNGTLGGTTIPTWQMEDQCIAGKCLYFDGSTSKVTGSKQATGIQTISFWIRPNTIASQGLIDLDGGTHKISTNASGVISATGFTSPTYYINGNATTTPTLVINQWNFVEITTGTGFNSTSSFTIGTDGTNFIKGFIDDVKFYNYARSAAQVLTDYASRGSVKGTSAAFGSSDLLSKSLSNGLVGYWKMDEASWNNNCSATSVIDSSGNGNNGQACPATTGPTGGATGKFGNAGSFDGSNDYVEMGNPSALQITGAMTISAWVYLSVKPAAESYIVSKLTGTRGYQFFVTSTGKLACYIAPTSSTLTGCTGGNTDISGAWHLVTLVYSPSNYLRIYVDGNLDSENTSNISSSQYSASNNVNIGRRQDLVGTPFNGTIDEVRIYNRAFTPAEITALYNFAPGPSGYWKMDENQGTAASDSSGNGNEATLTNTPTWTQGKYGAGINFAGSDQHVTRADDADFDFADDADVTFGAWIKHAATSTQEIILSKYQEAGYKIIMESDGDITCALDYDSTWTPTDSATSTAATYDDNNWHYVSCVKIGASSLNLYIDGVLITTDSSITATNTLTNSDPLYIGIDADGTSNDWIGKIDEVKIYSYARTAKQVTEDMNAGHPAVGSPVGTAVGHWKFDEGTDNTCSGGTNDACNSGSQGSTLDGAESGMAVPATSTSGWTNSGKFGKALIFDGTNDIITTPDNATLDFGTGEFSISFWGNSNVSPSRAYYAAGKLLNADPWDGYLIGLNSSGYATFIWRTAGTNYAATGTTDLTDNAWHHIVGVRNSTGIYVYVDGKQVGSNTNASTQTNEDNDQPFTIGGARSQDTAELWQGSIDEVKVYNFALTAEQVKLDMNRSQAQVMGALSDNSSYQPNAANQEYCIPGDSTSCAAPVGEWKLEEGSGNANDTSGNGYTGTPTGTTIISGKIGKARNFNGTSDYITASAPGITGDSALTIEAWVYLTGSVSGTPNVIVFGTHANDQAAALFIRNTGAFTIGTQGGTYATGTTTDTQNKWFHVAGTYSGSSGTWNIYVNGVLEGTQAESAPLPNFGTTRTRFGSTTNDTPGQFFAGKIDQVRIFNYVRSAAQVAWDYNRGGPVGWWKFDECQGTVANDSSGNGNTGTITPGGAPNASVGTCTASATTMWYNGRTGKYNSSLDFDGTDDYVTIGDVASGLSTITISAWINASDITPASQLSIVSKADATPYTDLEYNLNLETDGRIRFWTSTDGAGNTGRLAYSTGSIISGWNHVVATYDGSNTYVYLNGVRGTAVSTTGTIYNGTANLLIGDTPDTGWEFTGQIDDVKIFNYALTATQVKTLFNDGAVRFGPVTGSP